jgi:hypothetical protein
VHAPEREAPLIPLREMVHAGTIRVDKTQTRRTQRAISGFQRPESEIAEVAAGSKPSSPQTRLSIQGTAAFAHPMVVAANVSLRKLSKP